MSVEFEPIPGFDNDEVKYKSKPYPKPPKKSNLPNPYYTALVIGSTGSGKTHSVVKQLKYLEKAKYYNKEGEIIKQRIFVICPTIAANEIYFTLKNLDEDDVITDYTDAKLLAVLDEIKQIKEEAEEYQENVKLYKRFEKATSINRFTPEEIMRLDMMGYELPKKPKYEHPPVNHIILDDLLCEKGAFKPNGASAISNLCVKNRHLTCNVYVLGQSSAQVPKVIRSQARILMLYRFNSKKITDDLYDTVSSLLSPEEFENIYDSCTKEKYNFLYVDTTHSDLILKKNFNYLIKIKRKKKEV